MPHLMINFMRAPVVAVILYALTVGNVQTLVCQEPGAPDSRALSCLAPSTSDLLSFLGSHGNKRLHFRLRHGGIPGSSDQRIQLPQLTVVFYSANRTAAVVDSAVISGDNVLLKDGAFLLRHRSGHWIVVQGPGGVGTFREVEKLMLSMNDLSFGEMDVPSNTPAYCISPTEWNVPGSKYIPYQK